MIKPQDRVRSQKAKVRRQEITKCKTQNHSEGILKTGFRPVFFVGGIELIDFLVD